MLYLSKILPTIISPLFICLVLILVSLVTKKSRYSILSISLLTICSLPITANIATKYLEKGHLPKTVNEIDSADAIVVLSGLLRTVKFGSSFTYDLTEAADRLIAGIDLINAKKAPFIIFTRGQHPWSLGRPEGEILANLAVKFGVQKEKILMTRPVHNTSDEARAVKELLSSPRNKIILVTSAFHLKRAEKVFTKSKITVLPYPVDFRTEVSKLTLLDLIPNSESLYKSSIAVREMFGRLYYY